MSRGSLRVAIQGALGAFSHEAALRLLGDDVEVVPCTTFEALYAALDENRADYLLAPMENSLIGSIHRSQDLLVASDLHIVGEVVIPIAHHLIGCPGATLEEIEVVQSHPAALAQCERFFLSHPQVRRVTAEDTAGSVQEVISKGDPRRAAIASRLAARQYGAVVLREHLEDHQENYTRFLLLSREPQESPAADKVSLIMRVKHHPGSLVEALEPFSRRAINLLKIESRPIAGSPWQYSFHLDLEGALWHPELAAALEELRSRTDEVRVLGCYPAALSSGTAGV